MQMHFPTVPLAYRLITQLPVMQTNTDSFDTPITQPVTLYYFCLRHQLLKEIKHQIQLLWVCLWKEMPQ